MIDKPGDYVYRSDGGTDVCGFYAIAHPDQIIEIEFHEFDVDCRDGGLVAVS